MTYLTTLAPNINSVFNVSNLILMAYKLDCLFSFLKEAGKSLLLRLMRMRRIRNTNYKKPGLRRSAVYATSTVLFIGKPP